MRAIETIFLKVSKHATRTERGQQNLDNNSVSIARRIILSQEYTPLSPDPSGKTTTKGQSTILEAFPNRLLAGQHRNGPDIPMKATSIFFFFPHGYNIYLLTIF